MKIELGDRVRDKISGIVGIVTQRIENLNGCLQYTVRRPIMPDGKDHESTYCYDFQNLELVEKDPLKLKSPETANPESKEYRPGGPNSAPPISR